MKYFCPMIYNALEIRPDGKFSSCCITSKKYKNENNEFFNVSSDKIESVWNSKDRKDFIDAFDDNFKTHCKHCYETEKGGGESKRIREINYWKQYYNTDKLHIYTADKLEVFDIKMGNTCNLACAMCDPQSSSKWSSIYNKFGLDFTKIEQWHEKDMFWNDLNMISKNLKKIELAGGEPFMIKKQIKLIEYLVENDLAKNIDILWITNCTIWPENIVKYFEKFKFVRIMLSLDNTHEQFEYIRYPAKWSSTYEIFLKFKELQNRGIIELGISHSIGFLNAFYLADFHEWARDHKVKVHNNLILEPIGARELPLSMKKIIYEKLSSTVDPSYQNNPVIGDNNWFINYLMSEASDEDTIKTNNYIRNVLIPSRPDLNFYEVFPELKEFFYE